MTSGSDNRKRTKSIHIRCTPHEHSLIHTRADRSGMYVGSYLRTLALGEPGPRAARRPPVEKRELARLLGELGKIGSNLNQIARALHMGDPPDMHEMRRALEEFAALRALTRRALGYRDDLP